MNFGASSKFSKLPIVVRQSQASGAARMMAWCIGFMIVLSVLTQDWTMILPAFGLALIVWLALAAWNRRHFQEYVIGKDMVTFQSRDDDTHTSWEEPLVNYAGVNLSKRVSSQSEGGKTSYAVHLAHNDEVRRVSLITTRRSGPARTIWRTCAQTLGLPALGDAALGDAD